MVHELQDPNNDPRTAKTPHMTQNPDGSWKVAFNNQQQRIIQPVQSSGNCSKTRSDTVHLPHQVMM